MPPELLLLEPGAAAAGPSASRRTAGGPAPTRLDTGRETVVALRRGPVVAIGQLFERSVVTGSHLVNATELDGRGWWIPAVAVWCDGETSDAPEHPHRVGLATAANAGTATVQGLSDRLGWEAVLHLDRGGTLPALELGTALDASHFSLLDGRLDHDVPTVVVVGADVTCWGAASTWERALHRAVYGTGAVGAAPGEMAAMATTLRESGLRAVTVDLGSPCLREHGIVRCSVQLLAGS